MTAGRSPRLGSRLHAALLLALCVLALAVTAPLGIVGSLERYSVLSFDNPATQVLDELASGKLAAADSPWEATDAVRAGAAHRQRLAVPDGVRGLVSASLELVGPRAPPSV